MTFAALAAAAQQSPPAAALVLGSGLGDVCRALTPLHAVSFSDIPGFPGTTVQGHPGRLTYGEWSGKRVLVFEGRLHFYEGHDWHAVTLPVRTARQLGARVLLLTNASGGIADGLGPGSLMAIRAHLDCTRPGWWRRPEPRCEYSPRLLDLLCESAQASGIELPRGVYAQVTGPCYETPAEVRVLRTCGADAVGMSTGREAEAAVPLGMECAAVSCVANRAAGLSVGTLSHEEVLEVVRSQAAQLGRIVLRLLQRL
jgi:purine-nucleoside phosphorylase